MGKVKEGLYFYLIGDILTKIKKLTNCNLKFPKMYNGNSASLGGSVGCCLTGDQGVAGLTLARWQHSFMD